jgi:hypothetical protein
MKNLKTLGLVLFGITTFISCNNDDNSTSVNEEEVITTVTTTLRTAVGANVETAILTSRDLDGEGPNAPVITVSGNLKANTSYSGEVAFFNEIANPVSDITLEVLEEGIEHQLFFQAPAALGTFTYADADANGKPIGLAFTLVTGNATSGNLLVTLRHEPNKSAAGVANGDITNAAGATDAEVSYPIVIE